MGKTLTAFSKNSAIDHTKAPIYEALCKYENDNRTSMHVPGHKDGRVFDAQANEHFKDMLKIDATKSVGIDDLHDPVDFIAEGQALAADAFGADHTFFLVGGSTIGNLGVALTLCSPGDKILVQRNMHKSVFHGLLLAGAEPIYIAPAIEATTKVAMMSDIDYIEQALKAHPEVKGVWITNPNYYGMSQDIRRLGTLCQEAGIPLVVDEAHGAHFGHAEELPPSALSQGANIVVQSTHKMLTAMTMSSMLHVKGEMVPKKRLAQMLGMIQSTSPSYPLLASLDLSRRYLVQDGRSRIKATVSRLENKRINLEEELNILTIWDGSEEVNNRDPLKWIVSCKDESITGYQLLDLFYEEGCTAEISDPVNIVFIFSLDEEEEDIHRVVNAIKIVDAALTKEDGVVQQVDHDVVLFKEEGSLTYLEMTLQEAFHKPHKQADLKDAIGEICGETVLPYPPGIPLITPGEIVTVDHVETIKKLYDMGGYFQSPSDPAMKTITIIEK